MTTKVNPKVAAQSAAKKRAVKSANSAVEQKTIEQFRSEGFDNGVRHCAMAMLDQGDSRGYISETFSFQDIPFPFSDHPDWRGLWAFADWDEWVAADKSEDEGASENAA